MMGSIEEWRGGAKAQSYRAAGDAVWTTHAEQTPGLGFGVRTWFREAFLPQGYPDSVRRVSGM